MQTDLAHAIYTWILLSTTVWVIAASIARARVFRPVRKWIRNRSDYFGEGVSCHFCVSHWVAFAAVAIVRPVLLPTGHSSTDYFLSAFAIIGLSSLIARTIGKTPADGVLHPDEKAEREAEARRLALDKAVERAHPASGGASLHVVKKR